LEEGREIERDNNSGGGGDDDDGTPACPLNPKP
jgi:hypothetical protein